MELILGNNETLLKQWDYLKSAKKSAMSMKKTLIVTNKRIVHDTEKGNSFSRTEITREDISSVESLYGNNVKKWALIVGVIAFALFIGGVVAFLLFKNNQDAVPATVVAMVVGILFGIIFLSVYAKSKKKNIMKVIIYKRIVEELAFSCSTSQLKTQKKKSKKKAKKGSMKLKINNDMAREIVETIGSLIYE